MITKKLVTHCILLHRTIRLRLVGLIVLAANRKRYYIEAIPRYITFSRVPTTDESHKRLYFSFKNE